MSKDFPLFLLQNLLRCSQSFQLVVSNLGNTTATSFHFDWSKHFQQINPFKQIQLVRALLQNNLHHKRVFLQIDSFSSQARGCLQSLSGCWRGLKLQAPPFWIVGCLTIWLNLGWASCTAFFGGWMFNHWFCIGFWLIACNSQFELIFFFTKFYKLFRGWRRCCTRWMRSTPTLRSSQISPLELWSLTLAGWD